MAEKYIEDIVRPAIVDTVILSKAQQGNVTLDQVEREVKNIGIDLGDLNVRERVRTLEQTGHLRTEGNNLKVTEDGREDVRKALPWFEKVAREGHLGGGRTGAGVGGPGTETMGRR